VRFLPRRRRPPAPEAGRLLELLDGYRATCLIVAALQLGVIEQLPASEADLASVLGAHRPSLRRFLRGLRTLGLVEERGDRFELTATGRLLLADASGARDMGLLIGGEYLPAWGRLRHSVLSGEPAFEQVFGRSVWRHRQEHPELGACFDRFMLGVQRRTLRAVLRAFDFSDRGLVVDVGGGRGQLLAGILTKHSGASGILFDQPHVVEEAEGVLEAAGVRERCRRIGGSFLDSVPEGGDVYLLQHVLHDWDDDRCRIILRNCRAAMPDRSTLLIVESALPNGPPDAALVMRDLHMLVVLGGRERTRGEYAELLASSGFEVARWSREHGDTDVIEARPAGPPHAASGPRRPQG